MDKVLSDKPRRCEVVLGVLLSDITHPRCFAALQLDGFCTVFTALRYLRGLPVSGVRVGCAARVCSTVLPKPTKSAWGTWIDATRVAPPW